MRVVTRTLAVAGAVGVMAVASPAFAAGPYTVTVGDQTSGRVAFTAASGPIQFTTSGGLNLGCDSGTASGRINLGANANGAGIGVITGSSFTNCVGPLGLRLNVTQTKGWVLNAQSPARQNVNGNIFGIGATVADANGQCSFTVTGAVNALFNQPNQTLEVRQIGPKLKIANVQGCFGQVSNGQTARFGATYQISNSVGDIKIA